MNEAKQRIKGLIGAIGRRWKLRKWGYFGATTVAAGMAWLLAMVAVDNLVILPGSGLIGGWVLIVAGLGVWTGYTGWRLSGGRPDEQALALMYEKAVPGAENRLINAVQFMVSGQAERDVLAQVAVIENAQRLDYGAAEAAVSLRPVRDAVLAMVVAMGLMGLYGALCPPWVVNGVARLMHPFNPPSQLLATEIAVEPGNAELIEGQGLPVKVTLGRNIPEKAYVEYHIGKLGWASAALTATGNGQYRYEGFTAVWHPMSYRIAAGRSKSPVYEVKVAYRPRVAGLEVTVTPPGYTRATARTLKKGIGDVAALAGSKIDIAVACSMNLAGASLEMADSSKVAMAIDPGDSRKATASFMLTGSGSYAIGLTDAAGMTNLAPPRYSLTATSDQPPVVMISKPGRDMTLPLDAAMELTVEMEDDWGLGKAVLQTKAPSGEWADRQAWDLGKEKPVKRTSVAGAVNLSECGIKVGESLLYRVVAYDRCVPKANAGISHIWSVTAAKPSDDAALLAAQTKRLIEALNKILVVQKEAEHAIDYDLPIPPAKAGQDQVRQLTLAALEMHRKELRPMQSVLTELESLADGPELQANQLLAKYVGTYQQRQPMRGPILKEQREVIARIEALIARLTNALESAAKAQQLMDKLTAEQREQALKAIREQVQKLRTFIPEQDKVIEGTQELLRKGENLTKDDLQKIEALKGTEDKWAEVFAGSVKDIEKLTEQISLDEKVHDDYKQMVEAIEAASLNLKPRLQDVVVPREQSGRELAESIAEDMEMWLPNHPDNLKWVMEEPLDKPEIPMPELPDELKDLVGDLIEEQDALNDAAEDQTSAWADSISAAGWEASDGPISNFSAKGITGNQLPEDIELSGRAGDGRSGRSQGQMVGDTAKGLEGRKTPTRITNDTYEQGVVKELQQMAAGGATGGGKARGSGQEGMQGEAPPPLYEGLQNMKDWQKRIRQQGEKVAGQLQSLKIAAPNLDKALAQMKLAEQAAVDGRYQEMYKRQQMVLQNLKMTGDLVARETAVHVDQAYSLPAAQRKSVLDSSEEPAPQEYQDAVKRYFEKLSAE